MIMKSTKDYILAKISGYGIILMAIVAGLTYGYGVNTIYKEHNAIVTKTNFTYHPLLFKLVILGFMIVFLLDIVVSWSLYLFFNKIKPSLSLLAAIMRMGYIPFLGMAIYSLVNLNQTTQTAELSEVFIYQQFQIFMNIWSIGLLVFSIHLFLLGIMIWQSSNIPTIIGILSVAASICYFGTSLTNLLYPDYAKYKSMIEIYLSLPMALGELGLAFWLIFKSDQTIKL